MTTHAVEGASAAQDAGDAGSARERTAQPVAITCSGCTAKWSGVTRAHCSGCHRTFTGVSAFDRHREDGACLDPASLGMVERDGGLWGAPAMTPEQIDAVWGDKR